VIEEAMPYYLEIGFQAGLIATEYGNVKFANEIASRSSCFQVPSSEITLSYFKSSLLPAISHDCRVEKPVHMLLS